jgi:hypothetical protein
MAGAWAPPAAVPRQRSLAPLLLIVLLFQGSLLIGRSLGGFRHVQPGASTTARHAPAPIIRWRRSLSDRRLDPPLNRPAPAPRLLTPTGQPFHWDSVRGRKVALLFAREGSG